MSDIQQMLTRCWVVKLSPSYHLKTVKQSSSLPPFISLTSKRSKPACVITAGLKEGLLIISPLSLLQPEVLDVSKCWGARTGDSVLLIALFLQYVQTPRKCVALNGGDPSCKVATPSNRPSPKEGHGRGRDSHRKPCPSVWPAWIIRMRIIIIIMLIKCSK